MAEFTSHGFHPTAVHSLQPRKAAPDHLGLVFVWIKCEHIDFKTCRVYSSPSLIFLSNIVNMDLSYNTQDGLYDIAWSEVHENQLVTGSGDGSVKLWDITLKV